MGRANGNIDERHVKVGQHLGQRDEKDGSYESSVMQQTCVYPVKLSGRTIWLIDTPRIGDTCGLEHDKQGMADIVNTLQLWLSVRHFDPVRPNNSRLVIIFEFCTKEPIMHLHRSAAVNIARGCTDIRISNSTPGDTFGP